MSHSGILPIFSNTSRPACIFHIFPLFESYSLSSPHGHICGSTSSPPGYWYTSCFFVAGPAVRHEFLARACSRSLWGRAKQFALLSLLLNSRICFCVLPLPPFFLALAFPLFLSLRLLLYCTAQTFLWAKFIIGFLLYPLYFMHYFIPPCSSSPFSRGVYAQYDVPYNYIPGNI